MHKYVQYLRAGEGRQLLCYRSPSAGRIPGPGSCGYWWRVKCQHCRDFVDTYMTTPVVSLSLASGCPLPVQQQQQSSSSYLELEP